MEKYDTIIIGAGTGGSMAAQTLANGGADVLLVDIKPKPSIGDKVCGDVVGEHHVTELKLGTPDNGAFEYNVKGIKIYSPDEETVFTAADKEFMGFMLDRTLFGQWLLGKALDAGAELMDSTMFMEPIMENGAVAGIVAKKGTEKVELRSKVVIDASGFHGVLRKKLPQMGFTQDIANEDVELCYREIRRVKKMPDDTNYCEIYLNQEKTPGGYTWIFPTSENRINVGLGVYMEGNFPSPKDLFFKHVASRPLFEGSETLKMGGGFDPTRRPLDQLVGDGVMLIGDAASLVNPIHGGGIGPSMKSGVFAGEAILDSLNTNDFSKAGLWSYAHHFMTNYGLKQASLDIFRRFLIATDNTDIDYGMKYGLLKEDDLMAAGYGEEFEINISDVASRVFRGIQRMGLLNNLRLTHSMMKQIKAHYLDYPETPEGFDAWRTKTVSIIDEARSKLQGKPSA
ncbi:NAD(P)/FAD-dependent oxidoreductase [archaeon]|nr:NAD(P)/FAD-dependent oxidoreductase [archaeon]